MWVKSDYSACILYVNLFFNIQVLGSKRMKIEAPMPEKLCGTRPSFKSGTALG